MPRDGHLLPVGEGRPFQTIGNQLYQFAATLGLAATHHDTVCLPPWDYAPFLSVPPELFGHCEGATEADTLVPHMDPRCAVYLQDHRIFAAIMPTIRAYLMPSLHAQDELNACYDFWALRRPVLGVHTRRGDNAYDPGTPDKHLYHPMPTLSYYHRAIEMLAPDAGSIAVFGDDPDFNAANFPRADYIHRGTPRPKENEPGYADPPLDWIDFHLLAQCEGGHVLSNSTFGMFAALLADGPATAPWPIYGPNLSYIDASLMLAPHWIRMEA